MKHLLPLVLVSSACWLSMPGQARQAKAPVPAHPHAPAMPDGDLPLTGKAAPGLAALDKAVLKIMDRHGIPAAAMALARHGKLIYARGFGWADLAKEKKAEPHTAFGLASLSKPFTAAATLLLAERGKLKLDDHVLDHLKHVKRVAGAKMDPRWKKVTIRHLLNHTGGWDRGASGDPVTWSPQIARSLRVKLPITVRQFIMFMLAMPLDFEPGARHSYSNVGCILLDEIIAHVSGEPYEQFVRKNVLRPAGIEKAFVSTSRKNLHDDEARCYLAGNHVQITPMNLPMARAAAGWVASPIDMVRFLTALDGSRGKALLADKTFAEMVAPPPAPVKPSAAGIWPGLGWPVTGKSGKSYGYAHDGHWPGMRTFMKCNAAKGVNWALLFNVSMHPDPVDQGIVAETVREVSAEVEKAERLPDEDLFPLYK